MIYFIGEKSLFDEAAHIATATVGDAIEYLSNKKEIGLDIETTRKFHKYKFEGLDPYTSNIVMFQIGDLDRQYIVDARVIDITPFKDILENPEITKVGHNLLFEYKHLKQKGIRINGTYDTMLAEIALFNGSMQKKFGLGNLINYYFKKQVNKDTRLEFLNIGARPFTLKQIHYGADDITYPIKIKQEQYKPHQRKYYTLGGEKLVEARSIPDWNLEKLIELENEFLLVLGDVEHNGMHFNAEKWLALYQKNLKKFVQLQDELDNFIITNYSNSKFINNQLDLFSTDPKVRIKWTSSKQVIEFFKYLDACPKEISKSTGNLAYTVNATVLKSSMHSLNKDQPQQVKDFIYLYLKFKEYEQACTTFGEDFLKWINPVTGRIHSNYKQFVSTGRMSSTNPNLQNIPSLDDFRACFDAPDGCKIVNADYSGQETVVLANKSKEPNIIRLLEEGGDMHVFVAKAIYPEYSYLTDEEFKAQHKDKRQVAKAAGFALQYGGTGYTIAQNLGITVEEGEKVEKAYFRAFPELKKYYTAVKRLALARGHIRIDHITNRRYVHTYTTWSGNPQDKMKEKNAVERKALNFPIQGTSGSITKQAAINFRKKLIENNWDEYVKITNIVHDEINLEVKSEYAERAARLLEQCMEDAGLLWCQLVPLKADAVITDHWSH